MNVFRPVSKPFTFAENYNIKADYDMSMRSGPGLKVFFWTKHVPILKRASESNMYFLPDSWRWSGTFNRSLSVTEDLDYTRRSSFRRDLSGRMDMSYKMFDNLTMTYNFSTKRDLSDPDLVRLSLSDPKIGLAALSPAYDRHVTRLRINAVLDKLSDCLQGIGL